VCVVGPDDVAIARDPTNPFAKGANQKSLVGGLHLLVLQKQQKEGNHIHQQAAPIQTVKTTKTGAAVAVQEVPSTTCPRQEQQEDVVAYVWGSGTTEQVRLCAVEAQAVAPVMDYV
jgi:hypothetical protein